MHKKIEENRYYIHINTDQVNHAGSKAVADCEQIMKSLHYKEIKIYSSKFKNNKLNKVNHLIQILGLYAIPRKSTVVVEHPIYIKCNYLNHLKNINKKKNVKLVFIVHDLEMIRNMLKDSEYYAAKDREMFDIADKVIVHNKRMEDYILKHKLASKDKLISLEMFDYLVSQPLEKKENSEMNSLIIAGNLSKVKSEYIYKLAKTIKHIQLNLYGVFFENVQINSNVHYLGSFIPDELPAKLHGKYGVVWDGSEIDNCVGNTGNYIKYNNPHKVSLYVASGIPIIIWEEAAMAEIIKKYNIGICVESLENIEKTLSEVSEEQYLIMKKNVKMLSEKVKEGWFLKQALKKV